MTRAAKFSLIFPWERTLLLIGFILRLRQYFSGRSLWADEAMLALNIVTRSFSQLFQPLDYDQGAPLGFLLVEKLFNVTFGRTEFVLRLFPLLAGLASLWLFYLLLTTLRGEAERRGGNLLAFALFAVNPQLVYYSSESKQYIMDVAVTLGLLVLAIRVFQNEASGKSLRLLGVAGIFGLWFSYPALFVLVGIGIALVIHFFQKQDFPNLRRTIFIGVLWLANLALLYFISLRTLSQNEYLANYWADGFISLPLWSNLNWLADLLLYQFDVRFVPLLVLVLILGGWVMLFREQRSLALVFVLTALFAFTASVLRLYPVSGRLSLFLIPPGILLFGKAIEFMQKMFAFNKFASAAMTILLSGYVLISPLSTSFENFTSPKYYEHIRPTMQVLSDSWKDGDALFVTAWAEPAFKFYAPFYRLDGVEVVSTEIEDYPSGDQLKSRLDPLIGRKRVWVLFSHVYEQGGLNERDTLVAHLDSIGEKRREILNSGTSVYLFLYDLSK